MLDACLVMYPNDVVGVMWDSSSSFYGESFDSSSLKIGFFDEYGGFWGCEKG